MGFIILPNILNESKKLKRFVLKRLISIFYYEERKKGPKGSVYVLKHLARNNNL